MKKIYIPIFFTFIFLIFSVNSNAKALDLKIPENSVCEVRLGKSDSPFSETKDSSETAVIICGSTKKNSINNLNHMYVSIIRKLVDSYQLYRLPSDTIWGFTLDSAEKKSI